MMEFDLEAFVKTYIEALRAADGIALMNLISSLGSDEERNKALEGVIAAIEGDEELRSQSKKMLEVLEEVRTKLKEKAATIKEDASATAEVKEPALVADTTEDTKETTEA